MDPSLTIPEGYSAVDLEPGGVISPLRLCVLSRDKADAVGGHLVVLRDSLDARAVLGCVTDAAGVVQEWVQIWMQDVDLAAGSLEHYRASLSNTALEERWIKAVEALEQLVPRDLIRTGFEREPAPALFLDPARRKVKPAMHEASGMPFEICREDALLRERGLAAYSTTLHRYLYVEALGAESPIVAVTRDAPGQNVMKLTEILSGINRDLVPFNAGGGLMLVRRHSPVSVSDFVEVLGGGPWKGVSHGGGVIHIDSQSVEAGERGGESIDPDRFFLGQHGKWGRLVETLHLKLRLISDALGSVAEMAAKTGRPLLNVTDESFQVEVWRRACGLPRLWTTRVVLVDPGGAVALPIPGSRVNYYVSRDGLGKGIYRPQLAVEPAKGLCSIRFRQVTIDEDGTATVEATFQTAERVTAHGSDLLALRLNIGTERLDLHAKLESESAMASGELRLRSVPTRVTAAQAEALRSAEGVPMRDVSFETLPLLSTPCDLYALGVLGVRALLVTGDKRLPKALDEVLSLARQVGELHAQLGGAENAPDLASRVRLAFEADPRWVEALGPQWLTQEKMTASEAFDLVPPEMWWRVLAALVRMFPGMGPDSICRDLGDSRGGAGHRVFSPAIEAFDDLLVRTRSLMLIDWRYNREVHAVVRGLRTRMIEQVGGRV
ncbi:MAG: hypothetical protein KF757_07240 [Phycisphaeraceae bacterium]|nr:hypothetical protein [Phycisphaeraceae bacterium]MCW5763388.1 hypothetical protein [Phycisphaeraceae bacterium]